MIWMGLRGVPVVVNGGELLKIGPACFSTRAHMSGLSHGLTEDEVGDSGQGAGGMG